MVPKICSVEGCPTKHYARDLCSKHYQRWQKYGDPTFKRDLSCSISGCDAQRIGRGWCSVHYQRWAKYGDPKAILVNKIEGEIEEAFWGYVEKTESCWHWIGSKNGGGYGYLRVEGASIKAHRTSWEMVNGKIPDGMVIDHICRNTSCVNPDHLRLASHKQNMENISALRSNNTSGFRGVSFDKRRGVWIAQVQHNGKSVLREWFTTAEEAASAALAARNKYFTHNTEDRAA